MGALASGGIVVVNRDVVRALKIAPEAIDHEVEQERQELERREAIYRGDRPMADVQGKQVILIDDGLATGSTMRAAVAALRCGRPACIIVAVPVGAAATCADFQMIADDCICAIQPKDFARSACGMTTSLKPAMTKFARCSPSLKQRVSLI